MTFDEFVSAFLSWSEEHIETKKDDGFSTCPFARKARLQNKIQFIDARTNTLDNLESFNKDDYEIGIAWVDSVDMTTVEKICSDLSEKNTHLFYFTSTTDSGYFVKNFTNCVFIQLKCDILEKRAVLKKTDYYNSWPIDYYKLITGENS